MNITMCKMKTQIYFNRVLIMALIVNYCWFRTCIATTNWELWFFCLFTVLGAIFLLINIILTIKYYNEKI